MKYKEATRRIKELAGIMKDTDMEEIEYSGDKITVGVKKYTREAEEGASDKKIEKETPDKNEKRTETVEVFSHSVGIYKDIVSSSKKRQIKKGRKVKKGEKLGEIETMNITKEITSPAGGIISNKMVKNGEPVEYGQKLFEVEKSV